MSPPDDPTVAVSSRLLKNPHPLTKTGPLLGMLVCRAVAASFVSAGMSTLSDVESIEVNASAGGFFGSELKRAGRDAIFVSGAASSPVYILVRDERIEVLEASNLWGRDTVETEEFLRKDLNLSRLKACCIGPALNYYYKEHF